jgi:hypothetical protein
MPCCRASGEFVADATIKVARTCVETLHIATPYLGEMTLGVVRSLVEAATAEGVPPTQPIMIEHLSSGTGMSPLRMRIALRAEIIQNGGSQGATA